MPVVPGAEPFRHDGGPLGVLLVHGFTGSPASIRPWGQYLADRGHIVVAPRLPGHGTSWQELNLCRWPDWWGVTDRAFRDLSDRCDRVLVGGLSFGAALALRVAEEHGSAVSGVAAVNPFLASDDRRLVALPLLRWVVPSLPGVVNDIRLIGQDEIGYDRLPLKALHSAFEFLGLVREDLPKVTQPLLLAHSAEDHVVGTIAPDILRSRVSGPIQELPLPDSYHVATLDHDAARIFAATAGFCDRLTSVEAQDAT